MNNESSLVHARVDLYFKTILASCILSTMKRVLTSENLCHVIDHSLQHDVTFYVLLVVTDSNES